VLSITGGRAGVDAFAKAVGTASMASTATDLVIMAAGLALGIFIGSITVPIGGISLALGTGIGTLFTGLVLGWVRSVRPTMARFPAAAQDVMSDFGLAAFTAMVGLAAGPTAIDALRANGLQVLLAGAVVTLVPQFVGFVFGRYVLHMQPVTLLGALAGAESVTPAVDALTEEAKSTAPLMGFTLTYAISSILITLWGVVVALAV
jgi:putative transport protein